VRLQPAVQLRQPAAGLDPDELTAGGILLEPDDLVQLCCAQQRATVIDDR